jgi:hypothetical protein
MPAPVAMNTHFFPTAETSNSYRPRVGKTVSLLVTEIHANFATLANRPGRGKAMTLLSSNGRPLKAIGLKKALDLLRKPATRMIRVNSDHGSQYYVVPGGYVDPQTAEKIKNHPQVTSGRDGLWPGHEQTWRIGK